MAKSRNRECLCYSALLLHLLHFLTPGKMEAATDSQAFSPKMQKAGLLFQYVHLSHIQHKNVTMYNPADHTFKKKLLRYINNV